LITAPLATWANALTALRLGLIFPLTGCIIDSEWAIAAVLFTVAALTDYFDGPLARRYGQATPFGGFADHATDALFVTCACTALAMTDYIPVLLPCIIPIAFLQYTVDSRVLKGQSLRPNPLGRINGIAYYVVPGVVIGGHVLAIWNHLAAVTDAFCWVLILSTVVSMALRTRNYLGKPNC
jgi:CDP-diacylglycerol---glycerol-3-phosphate 3-phosphatidyltransferase